jgi:hypothetical protein
MYLCLAMSILPISTTSSVLFDFWTFFLICFVFVFFFLSKTVLNSFLLWKLHLKFVWNDNLTPLKVQDLYLSDVRFPHSFRKSPCSLHPPFFYHKTRIWSCPNWCDLKGVQLYVLSYSFDSVKFYVIIFCHVWLILEWHYV